LKQLFNAEVEGTTLVESRAGALLMLECDGDSSRVVVSRSDRAGWVLVSRDDTTAINPALAPDGERVAYLSKRGGGEIAVVAIDEGGRQTIGSYHLEKAGAAAGLGDVELCPWTPIAWSPTGEAIALFGCAEDDAFSVAVVADLSVSDPELSIIGASKAGVSDDRQVEWLDAEHLVVNTPSSSKNLPTVQTFEVP
jgi:hypothetical protein